MIDVDKVNLVRFDFRGILNLGVPTKTGVGLELLQIPDSTKTCSGSLTPCTMPQTSFQNFQATKGGYTFAARGVATE